MPFTPKAGLYYPAPTQAPATAADMMRLALGVDSSVTLPVATEAERDTKYGTLTRGVVYTTQAPWKVWLRTGTTWAEIYGDTGDLTNLLTKDESQGLTVQIQHFRVHNGAADLAVQVYDSTGTTGTGNIGNRIFGSLPQQYCPTYQAALSTAALGDIVAGQVLDDGRCAITATNGTMPENGTYTLQGMWLVKP